MSRHRRRPRFQRLRTVVPLTFAMALALMAGVAVTQTAYAADNPYERGPAPTTTLVNGVGPFSTATVSVPASVPGFGSATIYYPTTTAVGTFGAIALSPGFTAAWSSISWLGPRIASHGFVVIGIETNSVFDQPASRGNQLLAALDYLTQQSAVRTRVDATRLAVGGHSMGGGGALSAAAARPSLQGLVAYAPWHGTKLWPTIRVPSMIIAAQNDTTAAPGSHARAFYDSIPIQAEKAYRELAGASHLFVTRPQVDTARESVVWLKRFVDNDVRYEPFICPTPTGSPWSRTSGTCPSDS